MSGNKRIAAAELQEKKKADGTQGQVSDTMIADLMAKGFKLEQAMMIKRKKEDAALVSQCKSGMGIVSGFPEDRKVKCSD